MASTNPTHVTHPYSETKDRVPSSDRVHVGELWINGNDGVLGTKKKDGTVISYAQFSSNEKQSVLTRLTSLETADLELVKSSELASVATSGSYDDLINVPDSLKNPNEIEFELVSYRDSENHNTEVPQFENIEYDGSESKRLVGIATTNYVQKAVADVVQYIENDVVTGITDLFGLQEVQDLETQETSTKITGGVVADYVADAIANKVDATSLATVATTGSYNDLKDKPNITASGVQTVNGVGPDENGNVSLPGGGSVTVDDILSESSDNPVANSTLYTEFAQYVKISALPKFFTGTSDPVDTDGNDGDIFFKIVE